jgi:putative nucleotidyltransferase with HDIG domain
MSGDFGQPEAFFARYGAAHRNPVLIRETLAVLRDPACAASDLVKVLEKEPGVSTKVLKAANSAFFGTPRAITSLRAAIVRLGNQNVSRFAMAAALGAAGGAGWVEYWKHSIAVASLSRHIANFLGGYTRQEEDELFTMGLLHDLGVMIEIGSGRFPDVEERLRRAPASLEEAEREVFGFDHSALGRFAAEQWNFPADLVDAIACHHRPEASKEFYPKVCVIHLADLVCHGFQLLNARDEAPPPTQEAYFQDLNLPLEQLVLFGDWLTAQKPEIESYGELMGG